MVNLKVNFNWNEPPQKLKFIVNLKWNWKEIYYFGAAKFDYQYYAIIVCAYWNCVSDFSLTQNDNNVHKLETTFVVAKLLKYQI